MNTQTETNLSVSVLSIFEDDRAKKSRIQVKVVNNVRELSKFFYVNALEQEAVDSAIVLAVKDFNHFNTVIAEAFKEKGELVTHKVTLAESPKATATFVKGKDEPAPAYDREVPPPIPAEAQVSAETAPEKPKSRARKPAEAKSVNAGPVVAPAEENEWEEVKSPYAKGEESAAGTKADSGKVVEKVGKVVETPHVKYDKTIKEHRSTLATYLNEHHAVWKTLGTEFISKLTTDLTGTPFLDSKGNILPEFKSEVALNF